MSRRSREAARRSAAGLTRHRWDASLGSVTAGAPARPWDDGGQPAGEQPAGGQPTGEAESSRGLTRRPPAAALRWRTGRRAAALVAVVSVLLSMWFWWQAATGAPRVLPLGGPSAAARSTGGGSDKTDTASADAAGTETAGTEGGGSDPAAPEDGGSGRAAPEGGGPDPAGTIIVHVAGAVASPGVVEVPRGSRLHEAIRAAGGSTPGADLDRLNLAAVLADGQKVLVLKRGDPDPPSSTGGGAGSPGNGAAAPAGSAPPGGKINLNAAGAEELATLPRVGPVLAQRIVDWRREHGNFGSVAELDAVEGIGPKLLAALLPLVEV
ncbi:helix-hairpin-helix domain-containing protein [Arthrobacter sp. Hor0625]|uniref:helix-hairpin-helix domain-containing protein n=1 Tax=Arthrobacter sp. Hor0625 TaxID=3457358 RepID=UPI00403E4D87